MQVISVKILLVKHAETDAPYKNTLKIGELPTIAPTPIINIPVPKKKDAAIDIPKYLLKITFKNVYRLAQPALIMILPKIAIKSEPKSTLNDAPTIAPDSTVPKS